MSNADDMMGFATELDKALRRITALEKENEAVRDALEVCGLMCVWDGPNKAQIVCAPGRFEHARTALALESVFREAGEFTLPAGYKTVTAEVTGAGGGGGAAGLLDNT